jgi:hypothetical protein
LAIRIRSPDLPGEHIAALRQVLGRMRRSKCGAALDDRGHAIKARQIARAVGLMFADVASRTITIHADLYVFDLRAGP